MALVSIIKRSGFFWSHFILLVEPTSHALINMRKCIKTSLWQTTLTPYSKTISIYRPLPPAYWCGECTAVTKLIIEEIYLY